MSGVFQRKDLLGLEPLSCDEILFLLNEAVAFREILKRPIRKVPTLRGKTVLNLFFEPSTRTQASFDLAAKRLSCDIVSISPGTSSVKKGETLLDTLKNIEAMKIDAVVVRHSSPGTPHFLARHTEASVINAGDGAHEHPTQGLLDMLTVKEILGTFKGITVLIVGDILHSRVARSDIFGFKKCGARVILSGPPTMLTEAFKELGVEIAYEPDQVIGEADVIIALRVQMERLEESFFPSFREYREIYSLTPERLKKAKKEAILMHPGPVNWGVELDLESVDVLKTVILDQVTNGVAIRMAVLYHLIGGQVSTFDSSSQEEGR